MQTCHLAPSQESEALRALRECCCVLTDLYEASTRDPSARDLVTGEARPLTKEEPEEEVIEGASKAPASPTGELKETDPATKSVKKEKKEKKKRRKPRSEDQDSGAAAPEEEQWKEKKRSRKDNEERTGEEVTCTVKTEIKEEEDSSGLIPARSSTEAEELQERVDSYVSNNPASFELGTLPGRRSGGGDDAERGRSSGSRRPPEPDHPPPGDLRRRENDEEIRRRRVRPPKKNKGRNHRARGWARGYNPRSRRY